MKVKKFLRRTWTSHKAEAISCILGSIAIGVLVYISHPGPLAPSDAIQIGTLIVLIVVTVSYASATRQQAKASNQAVDIALRAEKGAAMPIIRLRWVSFGDRIVVNYTNVGKGPALRVNVWVRHSSGQSGDGERSSSIQSISVLAVGQEVDRAWPQLDGNLPELSLDEGFEALAEYADIHAQRFRSKVHITREENDTFCFERIPECGHAE